MANIELWGMGGQPIVEVAALDLKRRIVVRVEGDTNSGALRMTSEEAIKLRDDLSRAITEAAQQHAQTVAKDAQEVTP